VLLNSNDGLAHWGQSVTFKISTAATKPYVTLNCYQNGVWVLASTAGFFPDYPWGQTFGLSNTTWAGGAADCKAELFYSTSTKKTTLATTSFHVYA
jgi:hypothetical protein